MALFSLSFVIGVGWGPFSFLTERAAFKINVWEEKNKDFPVIGKVSKVFLTEVQCCSRVLGESRLIYIVQVFWGHLGYSIL